MKEIKLAFADSQLELESLLYVFLKGCLWLAVPVKGVTLFSLEIRDRSTSLDYRII